jgi:1-acyl-sn-glycerol-3-phosphate acyltransferase
MNFRAAAKMVWFAGEVTMANLDYLFTIALAFPKNQRLARAAWLSRAARRHLKLFGCSPRFIGEIPTRGLLVSNHQGYLDILTIAAATPAVFVSMAEVRRWPLFGRLARKSGTIFINRAQRTHVGAVNQEIESALTDHALVVIFPEGTSTNGDELLPFRSSLLEPALRTGAPIHVAAIRYALPDGDARNEAAWWGDRPFFPHLLNLLGKKSMQATVRFEKFEVTTADRKELAAQLRAAVGRLKSELSG